MVKTYSWHPGAHAISALWPVPVSLLPDELLSSWLTRVALSHGCDPMVLTGELWPKWRLWCTDFDRGINKDRLDILSKQSGISSASLSMTSLSSILSIISPVQYETTTWPWLLALGTRNRKHYGGLQYCSLCLKEDVHPYYRIHWRFSWHTICIKHNVYLKDVCENCLASIEPHRLTIINPNMATCASCGFDFRNTTFNVGNKTALSLQKMADAAIFLNRGFYNKISLTLNEWFSLVRYFIHLIQKSIKSKNRKIIEFLTGLGVPTSNLLPSKTGLPFELLSVKERSESLSAAKILLDTDISSFLELAKKIGINKSTFFDSNQAPEVILHALNSLPERRYIRMKKRRLTLMRPKSRVTVEAMFARLCRKYKVSLES